MKIAMSFVSALLLFASLAGGVTAADDGVLLDGVLLKEELAPGSDYCHMKFPAIQSRTLSSEHPALKSPDSGDIIDFYGACDESPTGQDQLTSQREEYARQRLIDQQ
jgi:hypothetical protein